MLLTTDLPAEGRPGRLASGAVAGPSRPVFDAVEMFDPDHRERLRHHALRGHPDR